MLHTNNLNIDSCTLRLKFPLYIAPSSGAKWRSERRLFESWRCLPGRVPEWPSFCEQRREPEGSDIGAALTCRDAQMPWSTWMCGSGTFGVFSLAAQRKDTRQEGEKHDIKAQKKRVRHQSIKLPLHPPKTSAHSNFPLYHSEQQSKMTRCFESPRILIGLLFYRETAANTTVRCSLLLLAYL